MKQVLIVVDYQKDFVDGALGFPGAEMIDEAICEEIKKMRENSGDIIFTYDTHDEQYMNTAEGKFLPVPHCIKNSDGWRLYGKTAGLVDNCSLGFEKNTFGSLPLAEYLRSAKYESVTFVGLVSNICVLSNAVLARAALPDAKITVIEKATGAPDAAMHDAAMMVMRGIDIAVE